MFNLFTEEVLRPLQLFEANLRLSIFKNRYDIKKHYHLKKCEVAGKGINAKVGAKNRQT